jgi:MYXO-CTERM domain-containing protein
MKSLQRGLSLFAIVFVMLASGVANAKTVTASSCELSAVQNAVSSASGGDTVVIPAGQCTWTGTLSLTKPITLTGSGNANNGPSEFGAGKVTTVITDNSGANNSLITVNGIAAGQFVRISLLDLEPTPSTQVGWPVVIIGKCSPAGCGSFRLDNIVWGQKTYWTYQPTLLTQTLVSTDNIFGVVDHNTVAPGSANDRSPEFINVNHTSWHGVGAYGDNSWASPDTFGSDQAVYVENNDIWLSENPVTENEFPAQGGTNGAGGGRIVGRFNQLTLSNAGPFAYHGTETSGRSRSGRAFEIYGNQFACEGNCNVFAGFRGGTGFVFGNTWTYATSEASWINNVLDIETQRTWRATNWSECNGLTPFDVNDGYAQVWTGTASSVTGTGPYTFTVSGATWTAGAYDFSTSSPGKNFYVVWDLTAGWLAGVDSNTASSLTTNFAIPAVAAYPATTMAAGDQLVLYSSTLYAAGTHTGASGTTTLTDSTQNWTTNQWAMPGHGYSVIDLTQSGLSNQIGANTSNTITEATPACCPAWNWNSGDEYIVAGYSRCLDQGGAGPGQLFSGFFITPVATTTESVDPAYEWDNSGPAPDHDNVGTDSPTTFTENVQYYTDNSGGKPVECSASHACSALTQGVAFGKLAYRPATCTAGVGYYATDQGSWNQSSNSFGQGQLFVCGSGNTWQARYTPYCYPHPLLTGGKCTSESPDAGPPGDAGHSGDGGSGPDSGGQHGDGSAGDGGGPSGSSSSSGCGCRVAPKSTSGAALFLFVLGALVLVRRRAT